MVEPTGEAGEECESEEEEEGELVQIDTSRKRVFQVISELETQLQFLDLDADLMRDGKAWLDKVTDQLEK